MVVQLLAAPAGLIFYLKSKYGRSARMPASAGVIGAIILWLNEHFSVLHVSNEALPHRLVITTKKHPRTAILHIWDGAIEFYYSKLEMSDPNCFDELHALIVEYFENQICIGVVPQLKDI